MTGWHDLRGGTNARFAFPFVLNHVLLDSTMKIVWGGFGIVSFVPGIHLFEFPR